MGIDIYMKWKDAGKAEKKEAETGEPVRVLASY